MKMKNAMSMFAALCLAAGCVGPTQSADEGTTELGEPAASDIPAEEQNVAEASMALETCNSGPVLCCNSLMPATDANLAQLSGLLGVQLPSVPGDIGLSCNPLSVLGLGGNSCSAQPVCCTNNTYGGLISLGCVPVNLNL